ncbi:BLUF domain-containing protein [Alteromonas sp. ASW11-36]|uniref:BLUF domain-containing protein n=1 Tax=Alteromonas arenosi TaxID=3055817 RepID=A0ABT7T0G7_9ALTE|nr:BLUF domain-containing protein [Alteromonas sp. ASW11-36]MDM7861901.1 BLUF domain-containing protein [Alteromonas sp. ASW11-36]
MSNKLQRVIYLSDVNRDVFDSDALTSILKTARKNNASQGITGMLVCDYYHFLQVLEGDSDNVHAIYSAITSDSRHSGLKLIEDVPIENRLFGEWAMGFSNIVQSSVGSLAELDANEAITLLIAQSKKQVS